MPVTLADLVQPTYQPVVVPTQNSGYYAQGSMQQQGAGMAAMLGDMLKVNAITDSQIRLHKEGIKTNDELYGDIVLKIQDSRNAVDKAEQETKRAAAKAASQAEIRGLAKDLREEDPSKTVTDSIKEAKALLA